MPRLMGFQPDLPAPAIWKGSSPPPHPGEGAEGQLYLPFSLPQGSSAPLVVFLASRQPRFVQC